MNQFKNHLEQRPRMFLVETICDIVEHVIESGASDRDSIRSAIETFAPSEPKKKETPEQKKEKPAPKEEEPTVVEEEKHTCEYTGKNSKICGKNAKTEVDGQWFCGTLKSGHGKAAQTAFVKRSQPSEPDIPAETKKKAAPKPKTKAEAKVVADKKSEELVKKVVKKATEKVFMDKKTGRYVSRDNRIVIDKATKKAIGMQDENGELQPLTDELMQVCDGHGWQYDPPEPEPVNDDELDLEESDEELDLEDEPEENEDDELELDPDVLDELEDDAESEIDLDDLEEDFLDDD